ncbi:type II CAAX prenyl endopeptidase Rce1 family protein [Engelhardtia mirabilis]|uniref:CPBP family glutamic-type intramembrane protease n=1 Tax=Engelhardtia mirabilis TaxID=2528011 RepID=UPI003AF366E5
MFVGSLLVGASSVLTANFFIEAHSPQITRARKRELVETILPLVVPILAVVSAVGLSLALHRLGGLRAALVAPKMRAHAVLTEILPAALALSLATPLLQLLCGVDPGVGWSRLFETPERSAVAVLGILSAAIQEDVVVRWMPIELLLLLLGLGRRAGERSVAVAASVAIAVAVHAIQSGPASDPLTWIQFGVPKALGALAFALAYLRYGALPAWLLHGATNLSILLVLPMVAGV